MSDHRIEKDSMGTMDVPSHALTAHPRSAPCSIFHQRIRFGREFIRAMGLLKWGAAKANNELGRLTRTARNSSSRRRR